MKRLNWIYLLLSLLLCTVLLFTCINNDPKKGSGEQEKLSFQAGEKREQDITIAGFGFARGKDKTGVNTLAQNTAMASLAEHAAGVSFTYTAAAKEFRIDAASDAAFTGNLQPPEKIFFQIGAAWDAVYIYRSTATVKIPAGWNARSITIQTRTGNLKNFLTDSYYAAVKDFYAQLDSRGKSLAGSIRLERISVQFNEADKKYESTAVFFIVCK